MICSSPTAVTPVTIPNHPHPPPPKCTQSTLWAMNLFLAPRAPSHSLTLGGDVTFCDVTLCDVTLCDVVRTEDTYLISRWVSKVSARMTEAVSRTKILDNKHTKILDSKHNKTLDSKHTEILDNKHMKIIDVCAIMCVMCECAIMCESVLRCECVIMRECVIMCKSVLMRECVIMSV